MDLKGPTQTLCSDLSDTTFYACSKGEVEMTFVRNNAGQVNALAMNWGHSGLDRITPLLLLHSNQKQTTRANWEIIPDLCGISTSTTNL